jgi:hypothetical protein
MYNVKIRVKNLKNTPITKTIINKPVKFLSELVKFLPIIESKYETRKNPIIKVITEINAKILIYIPFKIEIFKLSFVEAYLK